VMRGISPVIATVIILAVTVAIAVAVIGWITGLWGSLTGGTEQLQIYPDTYIQVNNGSCTLYLHVGNTGSADAVIYKVEIGGVNSTTADNTLKPGEDTTLTYNITGTCIAGSSYNIKVYTKNGNVFTAIVKAQS